MTVVVQKNIPCLLVIDFVCPKRGVLFKQNKFHCHHLGKDFSQAQPVASDVPYCVHIAMIIIKVVLPKCRKLETLLKGII